MALAEKILADAVEAGVVRPGVEHEEDAGTLLSTIMFNAAYAPTISGIERDDADRAAEQVWKLISGGIVAGAKA